MREKEYEKELNKEYELQLRTPMRRYYCPEDNCEAELTATSLVVWTLDCVTNEIWRYGTPKTLDPPADFNIRCRSGHPFPAFHGSTHALETHLQKLAKIVDLP